MVETKAGLYLLNVGNSKNNYFNKLYKIYLCQWYVDLSFYILKKKIDISTVS